MLRDILAVARKEFSAFFASPAAFLFLGAFLLATLFVFFWLETFFARNIADVRPMFQWLPVLLIFLVAAISMRSWSEERRAGTLESLLTSPVSPLALVLGKFLAGLGLVALALLLTLPLPLSVSLLGELDWGPVIGGYVATLFLAAAYLAIGQTMSARTDNPVVALILSALVCGVFYLIGSDALTRLLPTAVGSVLQQLGTGARFESITRGVIDLRDLYYYVSLVGVFLSLNLFALARIRRAGNPVAARHRQAAILCLLAVGNFAAANLWLAPVGWARADITAGRLYSLSQATRDTLAHAQEPLLIRAYFSTQTHPLLAPLVPQLRDLLAEYAVAGGRRVQVEFINPQEDKEGEEEAAAKYGVEPMPFQVASKYQAGVVSSYFDVVVAYGDQFERLGFRDLIEVKARNESDIDVALRDPEYAITRAARKVMASYQAGGSPFEGIRGELVFKGYFSPDARLPEELRALREDLQAELAELEKQSEGRFRHKFVDPDADGGALGRSLTERFGYRPQLASLLDPRPFWFYMQLEGEAGTQAVALPEEGGRDALRRNLRAALQRMGSGSLKTVALLTPPAEPGQRDGYSTLRGVLQANARVIEADLSGGQVPAEADMLLVLAPRALDEKQVFAIDQFLMQGGSVVLASSPLNVSFTDEIFASEQKSGLEDWLAHHGLSVQPRLVLDAQNTPLPVPSVRYIGGMALREMRMLPYPPFADVRGGGLASDSPITASLGQLTFNWASPLQLAADKQAGRKFSVLAKSSPQAWLGEAAQVMPDFRAHPDSGYGEPGERASHTLAVALEGRFNSFFKERPAALASDRPAASVIAHSPENARLVVVAANSFASDTAINLASSTLGTLYTAPLAFMQNAVDWSLEEPALMALRGRTRFARTLVAAEPEIRQFWEGLNYALALGGLGVVWLVRRGLRIARRKHEDLILKEISA